MATGLEHVFAAVPQAFQTAKLRQLQLKLQQHCEAEQLTRLNALLSTEPAQELCRILWASEYAAQQLCEHPDWLLELLESDARISRDEQFYAEYFEHSHQDQATFDRFLRARRHRALCRIIWRDFNGLATTVETIAELSHLAAAALQASLDFHFKHLSQSLGAPMSEQGRPQGLLIIGMGKLGAWELNLSSDIDLIFAYPEGGATRGANKCVSNQEFFSKLGQKIIHSLDHISAEGFVFRVDMRLRPYGQSGALVSSFDALEDYYQTQGREWERFAMIKARVVAHNTSTADVEGLMAILRGFTYRRYVDFTAIDALRDLKQLINRENRKRDTADNIKLGRGGIREVEFIAQAFQLIRGGRDLELQNRALLQVLPMLERLRCLPEGTAERLSRAYCFLRDVEHGIQGYRDQQDQRLPSTDTGRLRLAKLLGFADWASFKQQLQQHQQCIVEQFSAVIADADEQAQEHQQQALQHWRSYWKHLTHARSDDTDSADSTAELLKQGLLSHPNVVAMSALGAERFDDFMPRLLALLEEQDPDKIILKRLLPLLIAIARRSVYLLLLSENPAALERLVKLSEASPWISEQMARNPALLDELLDPAALYCMLDPRALQTELQQQTLRLQPNDLEAQMLALRYFRLAQALRIAACEVTERLPLMKVSDHLSDLAQSILQYVLTLAWQEMTRTYGYPGGVVTEQAEFLILAYGKLGGYELGHGSDLDLVFIHDADAMGTTTGNAEQQRSIDNLTFFVRLGQKIIHILNTQMPSGKLYEVDMRLRPSGNSGLLVSTFSAFAKYQQDSAWTWEHQALVRARPVVGSAALQERFEQLRKTVLCRPRELPKLRSDVVAMRQKMRDQLGSNKKQREGGLFHIKQDAGGIVDIEFMVQYAVLAWSHTHPRLTEFTDNIRILECLAATELVSTQEVQQLTDAYIALRSIGHRLALQQRTNLVELAELERNSGLEQHISNVKKIWRALLEQESN